MRFGAQPLYDLNGTMGVFIKAILVPRIDSVSFFLHFAFQLTHLISHIGVQGLCRVWSPCASDRAGFQRLRVLVSLGKCAASADPSVRAMLPRDTNCVTRLLPFSVNTFAKGVAVTKII